MAQARKANVPKTIDCPYSEGVTITFLSAMDIDKRGELYDFLSSLPEKRTTKDQISFYRLVLKKALTGCENVLNEDSIPLLINGEGATDKVLDTLQEVLLPGSGYENLLSWAGSEVWKAATLSEETKKNSDSSSSPKSTDFVMKVLTPTSTIDSTQGKNSDD